jgi:hypothetical protein
VTPVFNMVAAPLFICDCLFISHLCHMKIPMKGKYL